LPLALIHLNGICFYQAVLEAQPATLIFCHTPEKSPLAQL
jgi:hypothetical protein